MANAHFVMTAELKWSNKRAMRALRELLQAASSISQDQPWNDDAKQIAKSARYLAKHVVVDLEHRSA